MILSAVILARTISKELFEMTCHCIATLRSSEPDFTIEIIVVESNKNYYESDFKYPDSVKIIIPDADFNFHKFLNVGIREASGDYIALCNNDLVFHDRWFSEILSVSSQNQHILSFSPVGNKIEKKPGQIFEIGYKVMTHVKGWCIVVRREIFDTIGLLDETFDFYYADNDYAMTLKGRNIPHALVFQSEVTHLEKKKPAGDNTPPDLSFVKKYKIPKYMNQDKYRWVFNSERVLSDFLKFHNKWGNPDLLYRKNKLADILKNYHLQFLIPFFFKIKF